MPRRTTTAPTRDRTRVVQRLTTLAAFAAAAQAVIYLVLAFAYRFAAGAVLGALNGQGAQNSQATEGAAALLVMALDLFFALAVGFFGARWLLRAIVRATPHPMKPPTRPILWVALSAAFVAVAFLILAFAASNQSLAAPGFGWAFELIRDAAIVVLFRYAAARAIGPKVR